MAGLTLIALILSAWRRRRQPASIAWGALIYDFTFVFLAFDNLPRLLTGSPWSSLLLGGLLASRLAMQGVSYENAVTLAQRFLGELAWAK